MKALHLTSDTTAEKVVEALLNKFKIIDNPMKFALFERFKKEEGHGECGSPCWVLRLRS